MGLYDTFVSKDKRVQVQLKNGECLMHTYEEGDRVDPAEFEDAFYYGIEGTVVIRDGQVQSVTRDVPLQDADNWLPCITKWGNQFSPDDGETLDHYHPLASLVALLEEDAKS